MTVFSWTRCMTVFAFACMLMACGRTSAPVQSSTASGKFSATEVSGLDYGQGIAIADVNGSPRRLTEFTGKVVVVFFGFTYCPDVCPTTLAALAQLRRDIGVASDALQVLFITVDPERDKPKRLRSYVQQFDSSFIALRPDAQQLLEVLKSFRAVATRVPVQGGDNYLMDHTAVKYVYDKRGQLRLIAASDLPAATLATDLTILIREKVD